MTCQAPVPHRPDVCGYLEGDEIHGPADDCRNGGAGGGCPWPAAHHAFVPELRLAFRVGGVAEVTWPGVTWRDCVITEPASARGQVWDITLGPDGMTIEPK